MYLKHLRYLQLVIQHGSQAGAARAAGVSQSAIAQAMQALERRWGCVLFEPAGRRKLPTPAALEAARRTATLQRGVEGLPQDWELRVSAPDVPRLRVGMAPAAALLYTPAIERHWRALEPDGLLSLVGGTAQEQFAALERGELELAIVPRPRGWRATGLRSQLLHTSAPFVVARQGHALAQAGSLEQIAQAGWAVAGRMGTAGNTIEEAHRVRGWPPPRVLVQCADYSALLNLVAHSELLGTVPHPALLPDPQPAGLVRLPLRDGLPRYEVSAFWHPAMTKQLGALLKALRAVAQP